MNILLEYIKYRWKAKGRHGTHSPYVYDFVDKVMRIPMDSSDKEQIEQIKTHFIQSHEAIEITDLGAGSKRLGNIRQVRKIYKTASSKGRYGRMLYQITRFYQPKNMLELGTSLGIGTWHMHLGNPAARITTLEGCPATYAQAKRIFDQEQVESIVPVCSTFRDWLDKAPSEKFDLIFIDGHHDGEALLHYVNDCLALSHDETLFILDDIRWSSSMYRAWKKLVKSEDFHVALDLFRWGILVPRKHQQKELFYVR